MGGVSLGVRLGVRVGSEFAWRCRELAEGEAVGGTSWLTRFAPRGSPADYDDWAAGGDPGWSFDGVLPYFMRLEEDADFGDRPGTEIGGRCRQALPRSRLHRGRRGGMSARGGRLSGGRGSQPTWRGGSRTDADELARRPPRHDGGCVSPVGGTPPNLTIRPEAWSAMSFSREAGHGRPALGRGGDQSGLGRALRWDVWQPSILMRSGLGPAEHLRGLVFPVGSDLPGVGANLADHAAWTSTAATRTGATPRSCIDRDLL